VVRSGAGFDAGPAWHTPLVAPLCQQALERLAQALPLDMGKAPMWRFDSSISWPHDVPGCFLNWAMTLGLMITLVRDVWVGTVRDRERLRVTQAPLSGREVIGDGGLGRGVR